MLRALLVLADYHLQVAHRAERGLEMPTIAERIKESTP